MIVKTVCEHKLVSQEMVHANTYCPMCLIKQIEELEKEIKQYQNRDKDFQKLLNFVLKEKKR